VARISCGVRAAASAGRERKVVAASSETSSAGRRMIVLLVKDLGVCPTPICPRYRSGQSTSFTGFPASRFPANGLEAGAAGATVAGHSHGCDRVEAGRPSPSWLAEGRRARGNGQGCRVPVPKSPTRDRNAVTAAIFWLKTLGQSGRRRASARSPARTARASNAANAERVLLDYRAPIFPSPSTPLTIPGEFRRRRADPPVCGKPADRRAPASVVIPPN
jgi:hypothetical protein